MSNSHPVQFLKYAVVSGGGLFLSVIVFHIGHSMFDMGAFYANWLGDLSALLFVFICSWNYIFDHTRRGLGIKFVLSAASKLLVIFVISVSLAFIAGQIDGWFPGADEARLREYLLTLSKLTIAPLSLIANYLFAHLIIERLKLS